jgi:hypothetical protein
MFGRSNRLLPALTLLLSLSALVVACTGTNVKQSSLDSFPMASLDNMPSNVQDAPVTVQQAYQFAVANPEILKQIPCYCGCGGMDHTSNYSCYVTEENTDGSPSFDDHALGCSICVDITQDTIRLLNQDKSVPEILAFVDQTYASFGPSNIP